MSLATVTVDSTFTPTLSATAVIPVLNGATTGTGNATAGMVTLASLFAASAGPITTPSLTLATATSGDAIIVTGSAVLPAATVRFMGSPNGTTTDLISNVPSGGTHLLRANGASILSLSANQAVVGTSGSTAFAISGRTTALTADAASGAITVKANIGTGAGTVGGFIFQVPLTHGSDSVAQTLSTGLEIKAGTTVTLGFYGVTPIARATLATGTGATVDNVITALQNLGLLKQS